MTQRIVAMVMLATICLAAQTQNSAAPSYQPRDGYVPNAETAVKIAEAVLIPVYGEKKILAEHPFTAILQEDVWTVSGTLHCAKQSPESRCVGGTAEVKISRRSGEILHMIHYK